MAKPEIRNPILLKHAQDEFGPSRKWFKARMDDGRIRWQKVGRYVVLERADIEKLVPDNWSLVRKAKADHVERTKEED